MEIYSVLFLDKTRFCFCVTDSFFSEMSCVYLAAKYK